LNFIFDVIYNNTNDTGGSTKRMRSPTSAFEKAYTVKNRLATFPSLAGMSLTKLSLGGNNLIISAEGEFGN
jgi:hypothetical protein